MDFCKGKQSGCRCRRCADGSGVPNNDEGLTLKDAAIGVGAAAAAVGAVSLLGWGISSLFSSGADQKKKNLFSQSSGTTTAYSDDGKRKVMKTPGRDFQNFGDDFGGDPSSSSSDDDDDDDDDGKGKKLFATLVAGLLGGTSLGENNRIFMVHCDGSHLPNISGGYGALIRDNDGEVIAAAAGSSEPVNITVHELEGLETGLKLAIKHGIRKIIVGTDNQTVVYQYDQFKQGTLQSGITRDIWNRIIPMINQLEPFQIKYINSEINNRAADALSKLRPATRYEEIHPSDFSKELKKIISEDKSGKLHLI